MAYYIANDGLQRGPFELNELTAQGLRPNSLVWTEGWTDWKRAEAVPEMVALMQGPAAPQQAVQMDQPEVSGQQPGQPDHVDPGQAQPATVVYSDSQAEPAAAGEQPLGVQATPVMVGYDSAVNAQSNGMAVASLVLGILSLPLLCLQGIGIVTAVLAIVFGFLARAKIKRGETAVGSGMALAGLILGFITIGLLILGLAALIFIFVAAGTSGRGGGF